MDGIVADRRDVCQQDEVRRWHAHPAREFTGGTPVPLRHGELLLRQSKGENGPALGPVRGAERAAVLSYDPVSEC